MPTQSLDSELKLDLRKKVASDAFRSSNELPPFLKSPVLEHVLPKLEEDVFVAGKLQKRFFTTGTGRAVDQASQLDIPSV
jgi:hypothetical protein